MGGGGEFYISKYFLFYSTGMNSSLVGTITIIRPSSVDHLFYNVLASEIHVFSGNKTPLTHHPIIFHYQFTWKFGRQECYTVIKSMV